jgi:hypothetical protein
VPANVFVKQNHYFGFHDHSFPITLPRRLGIFSSNDANSTALHDQQPGETSADLSRTDITYLQFKIMQVRIKNGLDSQFGRNYSPNSMSLLTVRPVTSLYVKKGGEEERTVIVFTTIYLLATLRTIKAKNETVIITVVIKTELL